MSAKRYDVVAQAITADVVRGVQGVLQEAGIDHVISVPPEALRIRVQEEGGKIALAFEKTCRVEPKENSRLATHAPNFDPNFDDAFAMMQFVPVDVFIQTMAKNAEKAGVEFDGGKTNGTFVADDVQTLRNLVSETAEELNPKAKPGAKRASKQAPRGA